MDQKSLSAVPVSVRVAVLSALAARSVAVAEGDQIIVGVPPAVTGPLEAVPSVIVIVLPLCTIVDPVPVKPNVALELT
jgi:hypothetical protein